MSEFVWGLILGGILGVIFDRIYAAYEERQKLKITTGYYWSVDPKDEGLQLAITNKGRKPLPPYRLAVFHRMRGTYFFDESESDKELLPNQSRKHKFSSEGYDSFVSFFFSKAHSHDSLEPIPHNFSDSPAPYGAEFQLVQSESEHIIFASKMIGDELLRVVHGFATSNDRPEIIWNNLRC